ncbi:MAG TPA: ABC transporter ATP-binding protein [Candidatus Cybelea sp.]|nr:ABC transporter ATP-binding protein [Candidatus Cybelea sp.]
MNAAPLLRIAGVSKRFGTITALDHVSLDVFAGEFFALLGPSGCGKTTLLRMIAGFESPDEGTVHLDGADLAGVPPYRRPVNMVFQSYALFPHLSVEQNVAFGLRQEGLPAEDIAARVVEMLELVELSSAAKRKPDQLSGGQRQRVALARALVKQPKLLLLDEPLAALDRRLRERTRSELVDLQRRTGVAFVLVTHDQEEAMSLAARIAVMDRGRVVQVGTPAEIYEQPVSRWVAEFVGDVNVIAGHVVHHGGAAELRTEAGWRIGVPANAADGPAVLSLRPEQLDIVHAAPAPGDANCIAGDVVEVGYLGSQSLLRVRVDRHMTISVMRANRPGAERRDARVGERVYVVWPVGAGVMLPP